MTRHVVCYNSLESKNLVEDMVQNNSIPIPQAYRHLVIFFDDSYKPKEKNISELEEAIGVVKEEIESIEKGKFVVKNVVIPNFHKFGPPSPSSYEAVLFLQTYLSRFAHQLTECMQHLQDDLFSKRHQLEKRRLKRKRYTENLKNRRNVSGLFN